CGPFGRGSAKASSVTPSDGVRLVDQAVRCRAWFVVGRLSGQSWRRAPNMISSHVGTEARRLRLRPWRAGAGLGAGAGVGASSLAAGFCLPWSSLLVLAAGTAFAAALPLLC